jgi:hypothetical protein
MPETEDQLLDAAQEFLQEAGADVLVLGGISIRHQPEAREANHELVVRFTGRLPKRKLCPVHNMPDCSPMLNGCSELTGA